MQIVDPKKFIIKEKTNFHKIKDLKKDAVRELIDQINCCDKCFKDKKKIEFNVSILKKYLKVPVEQKVVNRAYMYLQNILTK